MGCDVPHIITSLKKKIGLKVNTPMPSALIAKNKVLMKNFFYQNKIKTARYIVSSKEKKIINFWKKEGFKSGVLKLSNQSGSRGVRHVKNFSEVKKILKEIISMSNDKIIFEEFLDGDQISTESLIINQDKIVTPGFVDRDYTLNQFLYPSMIENGAVNPSKNKKYKSKINLIIKKIARKLKIKNGVIKADFVIKNQKPYIIEFANRLSGGDFSESLVPIGQGINYVKEAVRLEVYGKVELKLLKNKLNKFVSNKYFFLKNGRFSKALNIKKVKPLKYLKKIDIYQNKNSLVSKIDEHKKRSGVFIVTGKSKNNLKLNIKNIYDNILFVIDGKKTKGIF